MQTKKITLDDLVVEIKGFNPFMPDIQTINFADKTVTVLDINSEKHVISLSDPEVSLTRVVPNNEPI